VRRRLLDEVRQAAAFVADHAELVRIDETRLEMFARHLLPQIRAGVRLDRDYFYLGDPKTTLAYVVTFNALNFGSGWWPHLVKIPGRSGSITVMTRLRDRFSSAGPLSAAELTTMTPSACAVLFGQPLRPPIDELMTHFTRALHELGRLLLDSYDGSFDALVEEAGGRAEHLVELLLAMPMYRDVAHYRGRTVPMLKRAQLTTADLALALTGSGLGRFSDLDRLTVFADNLVPHVLRLEGVLVFDADLVRDIEEARLLQPCGEAETEIRAVAIDSVERMVALLRENGESVSAWEIDYVLWQSGQDPRYKAKPRHRARSIYY
jgi:Potential Queuosine, Q, salvage protein family